MNALPPIFVLGHASRSGLILPHLSRLSHTLVINPDWHYEGITLDPIYVKKVPITHYRVYRGWQIMAGQFLQTPHRFGLFFEDDAVPKKEFSHNWHELCEHYTNFMEGRFDLMYLAGRCYKPERFDVVGHVLGQPIRTLKQGAGTDEACGFGGRNHVFGCCAAMMSRTGAEKMRSLPWAGIPGDVHFPDSMDFGFVSHEDSLFVHDSSQGSLIDPTVPKKFL